MVEIAGYDLEETLPLVGTSIWALIVALVVLVVGYFVIEYAVKYLKKSLIKAKTGEILAQFASKVVRMLFLVFLLGTVLGIVGVSIGPALISLSVVLGFVLGFALGDTLSNIAAGFMIATTKPFKVGDYVILNGEEGVIQEVGISTTMLNTVDNKHVIIPNKAAWGSNIINFTYNNKRRVDMEVGVAYDANLDKVIKTTMDVINNNPMVLDDPAPQVAVKEMGDSAVVFVVRPWCNTADYWDVFFSTQKGLKEAYDAAEIGIPFPQMDVHMADK